MPTLYRCRVARSELADQFGAEVPERLDFRPTVWPGGTGLVIRTEGDRRIAEPMRWGLPMARVDGKPSARDPVTLLFSRHLVAAAEQPDPLQRCLIVLDSFALPDGEAGRRTRTWFAMWEEPLFAWAGICGREPDGWRYAGLAVPANPLVARVGPHMPMMIARPGYADWLHAPIEQAIWDMEVVAEAEMVMEPTDELWTSGESLDEA